MTRRFILDENVVIYAQKGLDEYDNPNLDCADLVGSIIDDERRTMVVDDILWEKYDNQLNNPAHYPAGYAPYLMLRFWELLQIPGKVDGLGHTAPEFPEENDIPPGSRDDVFIVRLTVETGDTLVTADRPLREGLTISGVEARYSLRVVSPQEALGLLGRT